MATKQVKKTVTTRTFTSSSGGSESGQQAHRSRGSSPARISRLQEKDELTGLNDRLAAYIDHIRSLESENSKLLLQVQTFEETSQREVSNVKALYEKELAAARKLVDEVSKENAQLAVSVGTYKSESEEWMRKYTKKDRELTSIQKKLSDLENKMAELEGLLASANKEKDRWQTEYGKARSEISDLERQLASAKKQLEEETLQKVDLENRVQSLKEELAFKAQLHQSELNETRTRMEYSLEEVDSRNAREYETRLQEALAEFREQHDVQTRLHREELETLYESKIASLQAELSNQDGMDEKTRIEVASYKCKISEQQAQINKLINQNAALEARITSLESDLLAERDQSRSLATFKDKEIRLLREQMDNQMREYQDLLDIKCSLDLEIAAYRKLLEGEEERLNISQSFSQSSVKSTPRKRRRGEDATDYVQETTESSSGFASAGKASGSIEIHEVSVDGKFIKLKNSSDKEVAIGGWRIEHKAGGEETDFKFHRSTKLGGGEVVTVWSSNAGVTHDAATHNLVLKTQKWVVADSMNTVIYSKEGEEQASCEMTRSAKRTVLKAARHGSSVNSGDPAKNGSCLLM